MNDTLGYLIKLAIVGTFWYGIWYATGWLGVSIIAILFILTIICVIWEAEQGIKRDDEMIKKYKDTEAANDR